MTNPENKRAGLLLMGGGARAAYQIGVLTGIKEVLANKPFKFEILLGTSAGALNAAMLASHSKDWHQGINQIENVWRGLQSNDVYETKLSKVISSGFQWLILFMFGWLIKNRPRSFLDNTPLANTLNKHIRLDHIDNSIKDGDIDLLAISASSYSRSGHWVFYQSNEDKALYKHTADGRQSLHTNITNSHLLASSALPFIFPAEPIWIGNGYEYFGDGSIRQTSPLSPLIHFGATKILVIGCDSNKSDEPTKIEYPSIGAIAGHSLSSMFYSALDTDLVQAQRINNEVKQLDPENQKKINFREIDILLINPTFSIRNLAEKYANKLPKAIYLLLKVIGGTTGSGAEIVSYLLFEKEYLNDLIDLGKTDTLNRKSEVLAFFNET
jgi:NTE family protein